MTIHERYEDGVVVERWDDDSRIYTDFRTDPDTVLPYTPEQNARADALAVVITEDANATEIANKIETVDMPAMQAIIDQTNAALRDDPSQEIKDIAKAVRRLDRKVQQLLDGTE